MRKHYDFSKGRKNPYARRLKRQVTLRLDDAILKYFQALSSDTGIPYQTLINMYLRECSEKGRRLSLEWKPAAQLEREPRS
ncbi:MAG TPA: BrnA antitoxin family protein [bacterium]|nr:BrnA antitoxin family protein [bacterium]